MLSIFLLSCCSTPQKMPRHVANENSCSEVFLVSHSKQDYKFEDTDLITQALKTAFTITQFPLEMSDYFKTGSRGENTIRYFRQELKQPLPDDWVQFQIADLNYKNSFSAPELIHTDAIHAENQIAIFQNDIYSNSYFLSLKSNNQDTNNAKEFLIQLTQEQPWFEWNVQNCKYDFKNSGAQEKLIDKIFSIASHENKIPLYRGTFAGEYNFLNALKFLKAGNFTKAQQEATTAIKKMNPNTELAILLKNTFKARSAKISNSSLYNLLSVYKKSLEESPFGPLLFTSTDKNKAQLFSKGTILEFEVSKEDLKKLSASSELYIGVEYGIEIGFINENALLILANSLVGKTDKDADGKIFSSSNPGHSLWKNP